MLKNCDECNRVFAHPTRFLCSDCYEKAQSSFNAVKEYLKENQGASVAEVAQETQVEVEIIYEYIREGRLDIVPSDVKYHCEICKAEISSGRLCSKCSGDLARGFRDKPTQIPEPETKPERKSTRVHYLDQIKDRR